MSSDLSLSDEIARYQEDAVRKTLGYTDALVAAVRDGSCNVSFGTFVGVRLRKPAGEGVEVWCFQARPGCKELLRAVCTALGEPVTFHQGAFGSLYIKCKTKGEPVAFPFAFSTPEQHAHAVADAIRTGLKMRSLCKEGGGHVRCCNPWGGLSFTCATHENRVPYYRADLRTDVFADKPYTKDAVMRCLQATCLGDACLEEDCDECREVTSVWSQPFVEGTYESFPLFCC